MAQVAGRQGVETASGPDQQPQNVSMKHQLNVSKDQGVNASKLSSGATAAAFAGTNMSQNYGTTDAAGAATHRPQLSMKQGDNQTNLAMQQ